MAVRPYESCKFNVGVECYQKKKCGKCGWNPDVDRKRKLRFRTACSRCIYFKQARER